MTRILLGITGGIAAYKSADLTRRLCERGCLVRVVMTDAACEFITPLTLQALSGNPVHRSLLDEAAEAAMGHIELARWADRVLIAPASADFIAKLAHGLADDLLSTLCLATSAPIALAPAMNQQMWRAAATQANVDTLLVRKVQILGPADGAQACGDIGPGRMLEVADIVSAFLTSGNGLSGAAAGLAGMSVLVNAGPTREALDPVRFISNHSSGKMGYAVAEEAAAAGAEVTLVSGPTALSVPSRVTRIDVNSAEEMHTAVMQCAPRSQIFIATAAVADYRPREVAASKMKKKSASMHLDLERTRDIVTEVAALEGGPFTVGFAAETDDVEAHALAKLEAKRLDVIAANRVGGDAGGFQDDRNALSVFWPGGGRELPFAPKSTIARQLLDVIIERYREKHPA